MLRSARKIAAASPNVLLLTATLVVAKYRGGGPVQPRSAGGSNQVHHQQPGKSAKREEPLARALARPQTGLRLDSVRDDPENGNRTKAGGGGKQWELGDRRTAPGEIAGRFEKRPRHNQGPGDSGVPGVHRACPRRAPGDVSAYP